MISGVKDKKHIAKKGKKQKMVLAKDPKQLKMAIAVIILFVCTTIYNIVVYNQGMSGPTEVSDDAATMAMQQQAMMQGGPVDSQGQPGVNPAQNVPQDANDIYAETLKLKGQTPESAKPGVAPNKPAGADDEVDVMSATDSKKFSGKKVLISVGASGRSNPFLPAGENFSASSLPNFSMLPPPEQLSVGSDAGTVMGTTISGILYDKYSPSAIITIGGVDYLVKKGDVINRYNILSISKDQVIVQLGKNTYKAGVGQLLSQGQMNHNAISNLNKKFGGNEVSINVRKKGY